MSSKYTALPSMASPDSPTFTKPLYLPPYELELDPDRAPFITDIEDDARQRPRYRRVAVDPLPAFDSDPRFRTEAPAPITRAALLAFMCFLFWLAFNLRKGVWMATGMGMEKEDME